MEPVRVQKYLSDLGVLSRRAAERAIENGQIFVNGRPAVLGQKVTPLADQVTWDLALVQTPPRVIAFHKPRGIVTNCPSEGEREIKELLPPAYRHFFAIGRLDKDSEGLILLTDNGIIAKEALRHEDPHTREYLVWTDRTVSEEAIEELESGVEILAQKTKPVEVRVMGDRFCLFRMQEGKNRQIRRMMQKVGYRVVRLKRVRFGSIPLGTLPRGAFRELSKDEVAGI